LALRFMKEANNIF